jgi:hypothetical protein
MLSCFVFVVSASPAFPSLRLLYLTTVSQECCRNSLTRQCLPIPIFGHPLNCLNRNIFPTLAKNRGVYAHDYF